MNGATPDKELYSAIVCVQNNTISNLLPGDTVFVAFEESQMDKPVIIGHLPKSDIMENVGLDIGCKSIRVFDKAIFDGDIVLTLPDGGQTINKINLMSLEGWTDNIKSKFEALDKELDNLTSSVQGLSTTANALQKSLGDLKGEVDSVQSNVTNLSSRMVDAEYNLDNLQSDIGTLSEKLGSARSELETSIKAVENSCLSKVSPILDSKSYGTTLPSNPKTGQLFFQIK